MQIKFQTKIGVETEYGTPAPSYLNATSPDTKSPVDITLGAIERALPYTAWVGGAGSSRDGRALWNGSRILNECNGLLETTTPLCGNARELLLYSRAPERLFDQLKVTFIRNNIDPLSAAVTEYQSSEPVSWGTHVNIWVSKIASTKLSLVTPLILSMIPLTGSGSVTTPFEDLDSNKIGIQIGGCAYFRISQRAPLMHLISGGLTSQGRAIFTDGREVHGDQAIGKRVHIILFDTPVGEHPELLRNFILFQGFRLLESGLLDRYGVENRLRFDRKAAIFDLHQQSGMLGVWPVHAFEDTGFGSALDVQQFFYELAFSTNEDNSPETVEGFKQWRFVIDELRKLTGNFDPETGVSLDNLEPLVGYVDWVTKKWLIDQHILRRGWEEEGVSDAQLPNHLVSICQQFHLAGHTKNLFGEAFPRISTDAELDRALHSAPPGRESARAELVRAANKLGVTVRVDWEDAHLPSQSFFAKWFDPNGDYTNHRRECLRALAKQARAGKFSHLPVSSDDKSF